MKNVYMDVENSFGTGKKEGIPAGKRFDPFVMTCEENGFTSLQRRRGICLIFEGMIPKVDFYPVPSLTLFAHDGRGGYFAHDGRGLMEARIYFISPELECWYLAEDFRAFVRMVIFEPDWKDKITGEKTEICETEAELADFGMLFGLEKPAVRMSVKTERDKSFTIYENMEKAREKVSIL